MQCPPRPFSTPVLLCSARPAGSAHSSLGMVLRSRHGEGQATPLSGQHRTPNPRHPWPPCGSPMWRGRLQNTHSELPPAPSPCRACTGSRPRSSLSWKVHLHPPGLSCHWACLRRPTASSDCLAGAQQTPTHLSPGRCAPNPARGMGAIAGSDRRQLRTHGQGQHVGECPRAVEHQVELRGRHPAEHGGRRGPEMPSHFFLQSPKSKYHSESKDGSN